MFKKTRKKHTYTSPYTSMYKACTHTHIHTHTHTHTHTHHTHTHTHTLLQPSRGNLSSHQFHRSWIRYWCIQIPVVSAGNATCTHPVVLRADVTPQTLLHPSIMRTAFPTHAVAHPWIMKMVCMKHAAVHPSVIMTVHARSWPLWLQPQLNLDP